MPKGKKKQGAGPSNTLYTQRQDPMDVPSESCKNFVNELIARYFENNDLRALESKYVRYGEAGIMKFKDEMSELINTMLKEKGWVAQMEMRGYTQWHNDRVHDALHNAGSLLTKYAKIYRGGDESYTDVVNKAQCFQNQMKFYSVREKRRANKKWWEGVEGQAATRARDTQLVPIDGDSEVVRVDDSEDRGGHGIITRVRFLNTPAFPEHWEFACKTSTLTATRPEVAKLEHLVECAALRIKHPGIIRFVATDTKLYKGYAYWWNGGTIREMLHRDRRYGDNVFVHLNFHTEYGPEEVARANQLVRFRKYRTELAWALLHIMNEVHKIGYFHNDVSPDNILLHFPADESRVFIGVCDWGLSTTIRESMNSLYCFTKKEEMDTVLKKRYWVDPRVAYLYKRGDEPMIIPMYSLASEEYAVAQIAKRINGGTMSKAYEALQKENRNTTKMTNEDLCQTFEIYLERVLTGDRDKVGGLSHIINAMTDMWHWPTPIEHYRMTYE
jgi:hypothetical protein